MTKVLLVEDDNNLREIYEARLAAEGYDISAAQDGEEALEVAKKVQPDLIISDVMMPRISGFEMLDILRNTQGLKHTKVIMLTALGQEDDKTRADSLGADRYLVKSQVTLEDIVKAADELLNGPAAADDSAATSDAAPQPQQSDLSPNAPPAVAAAAHSAPDALSATPQQQPLSSFENTNTQPAPAASSAGEPIVGGPAPITTATVASDPLASNDQTLQAAAQALSTQPAMPPVADPAATAPVEPTAPVVPAVTPAVIDQTPVAPEPQVAAPTEQAAPALESQPVNQTVITPPEAQTHQLPSLPEIERAMQETASSVPAQGVVNGAPGIITPTAPAEPVAAPAPDVSVPTPIEQPTATPEMDTSVQPIAVEQAPTDPVAAASAPSPSSLPATGGQRTIQPLTNNAPTMDINQLAAQEGSVTPPAGTPDLPHQPGGVFTPDQSGSAADAAL